MQPQAGLIRAHLAPRGSIHRPPVHVLPVVPINFPMMELDSALAALREKLSTLTKQTVTLATLVTWHLLVSTLVQLVRLVHMHRLWPRHRALRALRTHTLPHLPSRRAYLAPPTFTPSWDGRPAKSAKLGNLVAPARQAVMAAPMVKSIQMMTPTYVFVHHVPQVSIGRIMPVSIVLMGSTHQLLETRFARPVTAENTAMLKRLDAFHA